MGRTAIWVGGLTQAAVFSIFFVFIQPPNVVYLLTPAVAGIVSALLSDRFRSKYRDTGGAGLVGAFLSLGGIIVALWWNASSLPLNYRLDSTFFLLAYGLAFLTFLLPIAVIISVAVGHATTVVRNTQIPV